ncbi:hypothetical protein EJ06DRAFT_552294 [Trichodelitschia bisporula]|uniref:BTB domain-containing protein n=1 Tax=Trichodelitschia bisporula TaxID=703511 RepID=A0A6G1HHM9_9PEZI|nr:hypothetical protein EJ06DRAFT_552294 [Trichodelitschia bisporula]
MSTPGLQPGLPPLVPDASDATNTPYAEADRHGAQEHIYLELAHLNWTTDISFPLLADAHRRQWCLIGSLGGHPHSSCIIDAAIHVWPSLSPLQMTNFSMSQSPGLCTHSSYFARFFSGQHPQQIRPHTLLPNLNVPTFVAVGHATPFKYVAEYVRTGRFPFLWTAQDGWDFELYTDILETANLFGVNKLCDWIRAERYRELVTYRMIVTAPAMGEAVPQYELGPHDWAEVRTEWIPMPTRRCARDIESHTSAQHCTMECTVRELATGPIFRPMPTSKTTVIIHRYQINYDGLFERRDQDNDGTGSADMSDADANPSRTNSADVDPGHTENHAAFNSGAELRDGIHWRVSG